MTNLRIDFRKDTDNTLYDGPTKGQGRFFGLMVDESRLNSNNKYLNFVEETVVIHTLTYVPPREATPQTEGNVAYYRCEVCGKNFADESGTTELTNVIIDKLPEETTAPPAEDSTEKPAEPPTDQPAQREEPQTAGNSEGLCKYCGEKHEGIFGWIIKWFHDFLALFGLRK